MIGFFGQIVRTIGYSASGALALIIPAKYYTHSEHLALATVQINFFISETIKLHLRIAVFILILRVKYSQNCSYKKESISTVNLSLYQFYQVPKPPVKADFPPHRRIRSGGNQP